LAFPFKPNGVYLIYFYRTNVAAAKDECHVIQAAVQASMKVINALATSSKSADQKPILPAVNIKMEAPKVVMPTPPKASKADIDRASSFT
jgi:hypothetical protein